MLEKRNIKLAKQASDFEKIVIVERSRFGKEIDEYEKVIFELTKKVSILQKTLEEERKEI